MLRAVTEHPKFVHLMEVIGCKKARAAGVLEMTWHFTGKFCPQGNIGKYSDDQIESWIGWEGEPGAGIAALVRCGWLDAHPEHRLVVHDWHSHADDATKLSLKRQSMGFVTHRPYPVATVSLQCRDTVEESTTESGLPGPGAVPGPGPVLSTAKAVVGAREEKVEEEDVLRPEHGMAYWDRDSTNQPVRDVARCLCRVNEMLEAPAPRTKSIVAHAADNAHCRAVVERIGWEEAACLYVWVVQTTKITAWSTINNELEAWCHKKKTAGRRTPPKGGFTETAAERAARRIAAQAA